MDTQPRKLSYGAIEFRLDEVLGIGSYGKVCKAKCGQLPCAAKLLHDTLFQHNDPGAENLTRRFEQECQFLSTIKHPNIVQYLGTSRLPESQRPVLLMELMDESLTRFLERSTGPLPYHTQLNICQDVALALAYLHSNDIIHRDLSSNNVLLIGEGSRAKVTDFGMSKLQDMNSQISTQTKCPGTAAYMPPEALITPPQYSKKLDCFSHGVLTIQVLTKSFPSPGRAHKYVENIAYPTGRELVEISETERRKADIDLVAPDHPLLPLALHCLKDWDTERPSADELCGEIEAIRKQQKYTESVTNMKRIMKDAEDIIKRQRVTEKELKQKENVMERERKEHEEECLSLQCTIQQVLMESQQEKQGLVETVHRLESKLEKLEAELWRARQESTAETDFHHSLQQALPSDSNWSRVEPAPEPLSSRSSSVTVHRGVAYFSAGHRVYSYTRATNRWGVAVAHLPFSHFSIQVLKNRLTTIGGCADSEPTNVLLSVTDGLLGTKYRGVFPPMPTGRLCPASVATPTHLVVAGGRESLDVYFDDCLQAVEVLDIESSQWSTASSLPCEAWSLEMSLCGDYLYCYYNNSIISCSLGTLLESTKPDFKCVDSVWSRLSDIPVQYDATLSNLDGSLLVTNAMGELHCFDRSNDSWTRVGKMLTPRYDVLTAVLPTNMVVMVGGNVANCLNPSTITEIGCVSLTGELSATLKDDSTCKEAKGNGERKATLKREECYDDKIPPKVTQKLVVN